VNTITKDETLHITITIVTYNIIGLVICDNTYAISQSNDKAREKHMT
jgi:hypothetical protein